MSTELVPTEEECKKIVNIQHKGGSGEAVYGLGLIGAWVYYFSRATTFEQGVAGFFKGLVWPAILVYKIYLFLESEKPAS